MNIAKWNKPILKGYIMYDDINMIFWESQTYGDGKKVCGGQGSGRREGGINR